MATFIVSVDDQTVENKERKSVENKIRALDRVTDVQSLFPEELPIVFSEHPEVKSLLKLLMVRFNIAANDADALTEAATKLGSIKGVEKASHAPKLDMPYRAPV